MGEKGFLLESFCWLIHWHVKFSSQERRWSLEMEKGQKLFSTKDQKKAQTQVDCGLDERMEGVLSRVACLLLRSA